MSQPDAAAFTHLMQATDALLRAMTDIEEEERLSLLPSSRLRLTRIDRSIRTAAAELFALTKALGWEEETVAFPAPNPTIPWKGADVL